MKNLIKPYWILLTVTLPQLIMFWLYGSSYNIIKSLLTADTLYYWKGYGLLLGGAFVAATSYAIWAILKQRRVTAHYGFIVLAFYVPILYFFLVDQQKIIPSGIPDWMLSTNDMSMYVLTFLMPAIFHSLFILVLFFTPNERERHSWWNFAIVVTIPVSWYVIFTIILPAINYGVNHQLLQHITFLFFASSTVVFFFFLLRGSYILGFKKQGRWISNYQLIWQIPLFIICPLAGLYLNNEVFGLVFGNFAAPEFYILAAMNGVLLLIPENTIKNATLRWLLFLGLSITFSYILYFLLVFLPLLPFSVIAIIAVGTGFLMLSPILIAVIQANRLWHSFIQLSDHFSRAFLTSSLIAGLAVLPMLVTYSYKQDRRHLHRALDLVYAPDLTQSVDQMPGISAARVKNVLENVRNNKDRSGRRNSFGFNGKQKPYLSNYYKWLVLDNLTLSNAKINTLENIFVGNASKSQHNLGLRGRRFVVIPQKSDSVSIDSVQIVSKFDKKHQYWRTWVHLGITNATSMQQEYTTNFRLPAGTWISNYYLMMEGHKEYGLLAEKKAAMWVYRNIVSRRRDPGLLHYTTGNQVTFRVFPFAAKQTRRTGIEFIHKEAVQMIIGTKNILLGNPHSQQKLTQVIQLGKNVYIPATIKKQLPVVKKTPIVHFVVDASAASANRRNRYIKQVRNYLKQHPEHQKNARITFSNFQHQTLALNAQSQWEERLRDFPQQGGFFLEDALKRIYLTKAQKNNSFTSVIVVSDNFSKAIFTKDLADYQQTFTGNSHFYELQNDGLLTSHSLIQSPLETVKKNLSSIPSLKVRVFKQRFLLNDNAQGDLLAIPSFEKTPLLNGNNAWENGVLLQSQWVALTQKSSDLRWRTLVRNSFKTQIMSPVTSFIAVENEAQKAALKAKQQQVLKGKQSLDVGEELEAMSEPSLWILLVILALVFGFKYWRSKRRVVAS